MRAQFILHASRAFFASAWADAVEESGGTLRGEIMSQMPSNIDPAAIHAAETLLNDMLRANGVGEASTMLLMIGASEGDRPATMEYFAHYAAMQAMGHGVGLADAFGRDARERVHVPYVEFGAYSLEKDYTT